MLRIKTAILPLFMTYLTLLACGREKTVQTEPDETFLPLTVLEGLSPEVFPLSDPACQTDGSAAESGLKSARLETWQDGQIQGDDVDLETLGIRGNPLRGPLVSQVLIDALFERNCDAGRASPPECRDRWDHPSGWSTSNQGYPLKICSSRSAPARKTLEHVALTASVAVEKAGRSLKALIPEIQSISPINILAMPRFDTRWSPWFHNGAKGHYLSHVTENLAYFPESSSTPPFIAVFPKSAANPESINLWESEFVLAHEFAHHVERKLGIDRFGKENSLMRLAASEAFADSLAFASHNASDKALKGIPCVGQDRAPNRMEFTNGSAKIIDDSFMSRLQQDTSSQSTKVTPMNCQGVLPQSSHGIGSIFAHWLYEFAKDVPGFDENPGLVLARVTTSWLKHVNQSLPTDSLPAASELKLVAKSLESVVETAYKDAGFEMTDNIRVMLCQKMSLAFPSVKDTPWFSRTDC